MARVAIIGASGKIGRRLIAQLTEKGDEAVGVVRKPEQVEELERLGAKGALVDIETADSTGLAEAIRACDAVVFTAGAGAGSGPERKRTVDYAGSVLSATAAAEAGIRRFIQVSAISVDKPLPPDADSTWVAYVAAKREADEALRATSLDWTILRPGLLTDEPGTGKIELAETVERDPIPRDDVAALILACLDEPRTIGQQWEVVSGKQPIADALTAAVR